MRLALLRHCTWFAAVVALAGCTPATIAPDSTNPGVPAVERTRLPDTPIPPKVPSDIVGAPAMPAPPTTVVPDGTQYVCVVDSSGVRKQTTIDFAPKVAALCARHPEMGPCQYERNICRRSGGRVYAANGDEITLATEAEYDKKVLRVRFRSN
ncbi:MAG: hypothetical protein ABI552_15520 [Casimicrobiaceae bacterium]